MNFYISIMKLPLISETNIWVQQNYNYDKKQNVKAILALTFIIEWRNTKFSIKIRIFIWSTRLNSGKFRWRFNLQQFCNDAENCFRNLKCLDVETWTYGCLLIQILKAKLPDDLILLISRKSEGNIWTLDKLLKFISDELLLKRHVALF